jgi:two-component system, NtrC family, sensor kinase
MPLLMHAPRRRDMLGDLQPVFATMLESAVRICDAAFGDIFRWEGDGLRLVATHNTPDAFVEVLRRKQQFRPVTTKSPIHIADLAADRRYVERALRLSLRPSNSEVYGRL